VSALDLTLHPLPPEFIPTVLARWVEQTPGAAEPLLSTRLEAARGHLRRRSPWPATGQSAHRCTLEVALGTALAQREPYWFERSAGLRALARLEPDLGGVLRSPRELLGVSFPTLAASPTDPSTVWISVDSILAFQELLRRHGKALREALGRAGALSYFAALVEATGYCRDRGFGLVELVGVADLVALPNPRFCRGYFDRNHPERPEPSPPPPADPAVLVRRAVKALDEGAVGTARRTVAALRELPAQGLPLQFLSGWLKLVSGDVLAARSILDNVDPSRLEDALRVRLPWLVGWALARSGEHTTAARVMSEASRVSVPTAEQLERFVGAALSSGSQLAHALTLLRDALLRLGRDLDPDGLDWVDEGEEYPGLSEPELYARWLALRGSVSAELGFPAQAQHLLEHALALDPDVSDAAGWLVALSKGE